MLPSARARRPHAREVRALSESFEDPEKLLAVADRMGLEGIVSKKRMAPYVAGSRSGWIKVKAATWRAANRERYKLFERAS